MPANVVRTWSRFLGRAARRPAAPLESRDVARHIQIGQTQQLGVVETMWIKPGRQSDLETSTSQQHSEKVCLRWMTQTGMLSANALLKGARNLWQLLIALRNLLLLIITFGVAGADSSSLTSGWERMRVLS